MPEASAAATVSAQAPDSTAPADAADATPSAAHDLHGLIRVKGLFVAIPVEAIREVVPCPARFDPFPPTRPDLIGAMDLRGQLIPVLDLASELGLGASHNNDDAAAIVVILRTRGHVFGMLAEAIEGVTALTADALEPLGFGSGSATFSTTFHLGAQRGVVLDVPVLASLPGLPLTGDRIGRQTHRASGHEPTLVFSAGGLACALSAGCVDASLPEQPLLPAPSDDPVWIGMLSYKGAEIPVVDTLHLLGHTSDLASRRRGAAIVVRVPDSGRTGRGFVALLIDGVDDIIRLRPDSIRPLLQTSVTGAGLSLGIVETAQGPCLLIDAARLVGDPQLKLLGGIEQRAEAEQDNTALRAGAAADTGAHTGASTGTGTGATGPHHAQRKPYLVFTLADATFAVDLDKVEEILPRPQAVVPMPADRGGVQGLFSHRGQAVPLFDLAHGLGLGREPPAGSSFAIVTRLDQGGTVRRAAFCVDALCSVERVAIQRLRGERQPPAGVPEATIRLAEGRACTVLDLPELGERMLAAGC